MNMPGLILFSPILVAFLSSTCPWGRHLRMTFSSVRKRQLVLAGTGASYFICSTDPTRGPLLPSLPSLTSRALPIITLDDRSSTPPTPTSRKLLFRGKQKAESLQNSPKILHNRAAEKDRTVHLGCVREWWREGFLVSKFSLSYRTISSLPV